VEGAIGFSESFEGDGAALFAQAEKIGLEGIVSKNASSTYRSGPSKLWLKTKCWTESELTLIGFDKDSKGYRLRL
jgi:ATP-dependent DNA ligase